MVEELIINKILTDKSLKILKENGLEPHLFLTAQDKVEFILKHHEKYNVVCDKTTFLEQFTDFSLIDVSESDEYLVHKLREAYLYTDTVPVLQEVSKLVREDSIKALQYLKEQTHRLSQNHHVKVGVGYDIMANSKDRLVDYEARVESEGLMGISTGIEVLDKLLHGWVGEDLIVILARTNKGKSWILLYFLTVAWKLGYRVVMYSGEMSRNIVGFRVDTLNEHFSNIGLMSGGKKLGKDADTQKDMKDYKKYIERMSAKDGFIVVTPNDFNGQEPNVEQLCEVWDYHSGDILGVDQLSLMADGRKGETKTVRLGNISKDLFLASESRQKPIIALAQAGRESEKTKKEKDETPELHHIEFSDAVGQNATRVLSMNTFDGVLKLTIRKNRYGGFVGRDTLLHWDINYGIVKPLLEGDDGEADEYGF